jgi:NADH-quinone oxidoreductase subunit L
MWFLENAWLIPVIPTIGYFVILLFGKRMPLKGAEIGFGTLAASFVIACGTVYQWIQRVDHYSASHEGAMGTLASFGRSIIPAQAAGQAEGGGHEVASFVPPVIRQWTWWQVSDFKFTLGIHVDGLSVSVMFVVTLIAMLIQLYSIEYVRGDRRFTFFFSALTLFAAGMLCMVIAESTVQFILGWEIMGLCSFLLIGHWWEDYANARAALKAFFTVRVGDIGLLVGMSVLFFSVNGWAQENLGSDGFSIFAISGWALSGDASRTLLLWAGVALFIAAIGKSGQFPLHTWLPDAMAGPTPVSALLHSSTMVVAGVYLVARLYPVFYEGFKIGQTDVNMIAVIGGITIIIAALLAFVQADIKRVLAYSTVSQLGYMMMGLGVGAWLPAVFHIFTHAFFKACLFLGAGSVSHSASHHSFDMKKDMGGLWRKMPVTFGTFVISTLALAGLPPLAGFFSKDEIIDNAGANGYRVFQIIGLAGAFLTAAYMTRCVYLTFLGKPRGASAGLGAHGDEEHELDDDRVLVGAGVVTARVGSHELVDTPAEGALAEGEAPQGPGYDDHEADHGHAGDHGGPHGDHGDHGEHRDQRGPHESNWLITVPLVVLAAGALVAGFLQAPAFNIEKFKEWVEPAGVAVLYDEADAVQAGEELALAAPAEGEQAEGETAGAEGEEAVGCAEEVPEGSACFAPELTHAEFAWSKAAVSILLVLAGIGLSGLVCVALYGRRDPRLVGLTERNRFARAGYTFLSNKYYLDFLYEQGVVAGISGPVARAANWIDQNVIDGIVNGVGKGAVKAAEATYEIVDQGLIDGVVNGAGAVTEGTGEALRPVQSGKVSLYGALLFGAAAVGALILVIVV